MAGALLQRLHDHLTRLVAPGVTTRELEAAAQRFIADHGARPSFAGPVEDGDGGFPTALCTSVGDAVVHGVPDDRPLAAGDLLSIDAGVELDGLHSDAARTHVVGGLDQAGDAEPMFVLGSPAWFVDPADGWTVGTHDGSLAAHEEHTVAVTEDGPRVLTASEDEIAQRLSA